LTDWVCPFSSSAIATCPYVRRERNDRLSIADATKEKYRCQCDARWAAHSLRSTARSWITSASSRPAWRQSARWSGCRAPPRERHSKDLQW